MKTSLLCAIALLFAARLCAEGAKEQQITGAIVALTEDVITIERNGEKWEIARAPSTKVDGSLAVGNRVTVSCRLVATSIDARSANKPDEANLSRAEKAARKADEAAEKSRQRAKQ